MTNNLVLFLLIIFLIIIIMNKSELKEKFTNFFYHNFGYPSRIYEPTRNMSYNLRGDPYRIPRKMFPFMGSNIGPFHYRKALIL